MSAGVCGSHVHRGEDSRAGAGRAFGHGRMGYSSGMALPAWTFGSGRARIGENPVRGFSRLHSGKRRSPKLAHTGTNGRGRTPIDHLHRKHRHRATWQRT